MLQAQDLYNRWQQFILCKLLNNSHQFLDAVPILLYKNVLQDGGNPHAGHIFVCLC